MERRTTAGQTEWALCAIALRDHSAIDEACYLGVTGDDFADRRLRAIWLGMVQDREAGTGPDEATLLERHEYDLGQGRPFQDVATLSQVVAYMTRVPARRANVEVYVQTLREYRSRRAMLEAAQTAISIHEEGGDAAAIRQRLEEALVGVDAGAAEPVRAVDLVRLAAERAAAIRRGDAVDQQLRTGIRALDRVLRYHPGHYGLIAARPSMGKTQLALTIAGGIARRHGPVLFVSVEMGADALAERLYSSSVFGDGPVEGREQTAIDEWGRLPVLMDHRSKTLSEVMSSIRLARARHGIVAFVVDYLQKINLPHRESREQAIAAASESLSALCTSTGLLGIVLSQLNRGVDARTDKRPMASDLRESGALEQDADSILMVYRDVAYHPTTREPDKVELIVEKQRNGRAHVTVPATFRPGHGFFRDYQPPGA